MTNRRLAAIVIAVVLAVWAASVVADVLSDGYSQPWAINLVAFGVVGFLLAPRLFPRGEVG